jgi:hypothetical protein
VLQRVLPATIAAAADKSSRTFLITSGTGIGRLILQQVPGETLSITPQMVVSGAIDSALDTQAKFHLCLCDLSFEDLAQFREMEPRIAALLNEGGRIILFFLNYPHMNLDSSTFLFSRALFPLTGRSRIYFTGSLPAQIALERFTRDITSFDLSSLRGICAFGLSLAICAPLAVLGLLIERRAHPQRFPKHCTSMTIEIEPS